MSSNLPLPPGWELLSKEEKVEYVHMLWDELDSHLDEGPGALTQAQLAEVERRIAWCEAHPDEVLTWEELSARLDARREAGGA